MESDGLFFWNLVHLFFGSLPSPSFWIGFMLLILVSCCSIAMPKCGVCVAAESVRCTRRAAWYSCCYSSYILLLALAVGVTTHTMCELPVCFYHYCRWASWLCLPQVQGTTGLFLSPVSLYFWHCQVEITQVDLGSCWLIHVRHGSFICICGFGLNRNLTKLEGLIIYFVT